MALPDKIAGFTVLPLSYNDRSTLHMLYLREHITKSSKAGEKVTLLPNGRTLFVVNIPPDATERELTLFFNPFGTVERVILDRDSWSPEAYGPLEESEDEEVANTVEASAGEADLESYHPKKRRKLLKKKEKSKGAPPQVIPLPQPQLPLRTFRHTGSSAHIVFTDPSSLTRALSFGFSASRPRIWPPTTAAIAPFGLAHYVALHTTQRPPLPDVKSHADSFLEVYEHNMTLAKQRSEYRKGEAIVDEDGFTLVTRGGAYGTTLGGGVGVASKTFSKSVEQSVALGNRGKKKPKKHEKDGFYKFQLHEQKRKELLDLKANFEKDKEKLSRLQESRKFKPY